MAHRSQSSSIGDNPLDPNYLPPHYREEYRLAIDALIENDEQGYHDFLQSADVVSFLARSEIEFIKSTMQTPNLSSSMPELTYYDDMPSIKEQARRLIKNACQVIAVVMDKFTDVDIFSDLLAAAARHVPVYILLDEQDSHHFVTMVLNCKVNLELIPFHVVLREDPPLHRITSSLEGWLQPSMKSFAFSLLSQEPLVIDPSDGALALSDTSSTSNYFSSQFGLKRTQSLRNPIGYRRQPELPSAFPYGDSDRNLGLHFRRNDPFRHSIEPGPGITIGKYSQQQFRLQQSYLEQGRSIVSRQMEMSSSGFKRHSYAEGTQENYTSSKQYMKHRVMNNLEETDFHREQFTKCFFILFTGSRPKVAITTVKGLGQGSGHGHYDRLRGRTPHLSIDQYSDSSFPSDHEPPPANYGRDFFSSEDLRGPDGHQAPPLAGRYGGGSFNKRPSIGQAYACQSSPTQPHPPEKKPFAKQSNQEHDQDADAKLGLRSWRINSYLSTYEDSGEEGLTQPMGPDAFEDPPPSQQPTVPESSVPRFNKEPPNAAPKARPDILRPRFGKPMLSESNSKDSATSKDLQTVSDLKPFSLEKKEREAAKEREREADRGAGKEMGVDVEVKETQDLFLSKHESFRSRINPLLQRSSRLRSSLIFSSSKAEIHSGSLGLKPATEEDEQLDTVRTSSIVAQILEKRRSMSREPFEWRKKADEKDKEKQKEKEQEEREEKEREKSKEKEREKSKEKEREKAKEKEKEKEEIETRLKDEIKAKEEPQKTNEEIRTVSVGSTEVESKRPDISAKLTELTRRPSISSSKPPISSAKPSTSYLKPTETTQPQKEENASEGQKRDIFKSLKPIPSPKIFRRDPLKFKGLNPRRISCGEEMLTTDATDAEKSELKKSRSHSSSTMTREDTKEGMQKVMGSNTSINTLGEGRGEGKTIDFLKKQTQRLKGFPRAQGQRKEIFRR
ncbi:Protein FAM83H [Larimichthys crocea]|uniref:Uncharacterized protein n=1 Tax=Larimichthys crocea TaxID=215358 RepID=A0ACD3RFI3_LARCR|nr:Protein FAM83H [Larimichthys crocea]